jgi:hypothetical protein
MQAVGRRKLSNKEGAEKTRPTICQFTLMGSVTEKYLQELQSFMVTGLARETIRRRSYWQPVVCLPDRRRDKTFDRRLVHIAARVDQQLM